jgi:NAD(P)H-hydrate epimerase
MVEALDWDGQPTDDLLALLPGKSAIAVGPGIGTCEEAQELLKYVVSDCGLPAVMDADVFTAFAGHPEFFSNPSAPLVITPHPGEMARLLGRSTVEVEAARLTTARETAVDLGVTVVLKGARTVIAAPDGRVAINLSGTPALAKAGAGDVLTGMIGAFLAMGLDTWDAALISVYVHGRCGEVLAARRGIHGLLASELVEALPEVMELWP